MITRQYLAPLIGEASAKRALRLFATGKITARELTTRLSTAARRTNTPDHIVREFVYRAVCVRFNLPFGAGATGASAAEVRA